MSVFMRTNVYTPWAQVVAGSTSVYTLYSSIPEPIVIITLSSLWFSLVLNRIWLCAYTGIRIGVGISPRISEDIELAKSSCHVGHTFSETGWKVWTIYEYGTIISWTLVNVISITDQPWWYSFLYCRLCCDYLPRPLVFGPNCYTYLSFWRWLTGNYSSTTSDLSACFYPFSGTH